MRRSKRLWGKLFGGKSLKALLRTQRIKNAALEVKGDFGTNVLSAYPNTS